MYENDLLNLYGAKVIEYLLAILYLVLFVGFWRWVQGVPAPGREPDRQARHAAPAHGGRTP
jgi:hypothetical protein